MTSNKSTWPDLVSKHDELKKQGVALLYDRVVILKQLSERQDFADGCAEKSKSVSEALGDLVDDVNATWRTLFALLERFPKQEEWAVGLTVLIYKARAEQKSANVLTNGPRMSWKERAIKAEAECERLRSELKLHTARIAELERVVQLMATGRMNAPAMT